MKKVLSLFLTFLMFASLFSCADVNVITSEDDEEITYKLVEPTQAELDEIYERISPILNTHFYDYNCESDYVYNQVFKDGFFNSYSVPQYSDEVKKYISEPSIIYDGRIMLWNETVCENDPLGLFDEVPDAIYDNDGKLDMNLLYQLDNYDDMVVVGYNKHDGKYIDWLIEGVWNGKADHNTTIALDGIREGMKCYYHNGFYYTPEITFDRGGGIFHLATIEEIHPIGNNKYEIKYTATDDYPDSEPDFCGTATIAMKEASNGFRFWSIYSIKEDSGEEEPITELISEETSDKAEIEEKEPLTTPEAEPDVSTPEFYTFSDEEALAKFKEALEAQSLMYNYGLSREEAYVWESLTENRIPLPRDAGTYQPEDLSEFTGYRVYYSERFDTMEKFDEYFTKIFTEETLEIRKQKYYISELDGSLVVKYINVKNYSVLDYDLTEVEKVVIDGRNASVFLKIYDVEGYYHKTKEYTFRYSDEYGWRFHTESPLFS